MRARHLALVAAVAATAVVLPAPGASSDPRPREAGCYDILATDEETGTGSSFHVREILKDAQLRTVPTGVDRTYYEGTLAVEAAFHLGGQACGTAQYSVLVYDPRTSLTTPAHVVTVPGPGSDKFAVTAWFAPAGECAAVRLRVQDAHGRIIDDAPDAGLEPEADCLGDAGAGSMRG